LVVLEGCGHLPMSERSAAYSTALEGWLRRILS